MPPRSGETCACTVEQGCWIVRHTERCDGSRFQRIWARGPHAKAVLVELLRTEAPRFQRKHSPLTDSGMMWPTLNGGWCALLCGRELRPARERGASWSKPDLDRLREAYQAAGIPGAQAAFPERTYHAITGALKRHKIWAEQRRAEAIAGSRV